MPYPYLQPTSSLGSAGRTAGAILVGGRSRAGSQGRIYAYMNRIGQGQQYKNFLLRVLGNQPTVNNPLSLIFL